MNGAGAEAAAALVGLGAPPQGHRADGFEGGPVAADQDPAVDVAEGDGARGGLGGPSEEGQTGGDGRGAEERADEGGHVVAVADAPLQGPVRRHEGVGHLPHVGDALDAGLDGPGERAGVARRDPGVAYNAGELSAEPGVPRRFLDHSPQGPGLVVLRRQVEGAPFHGPDPGPHRGPALL